MEYQRGFLSNTYKAATTRFQRLLPNEMRMNDATELIKMNMDKRHKTVWKDKKIMWNRKKRELVVQNNTFDGQHLMKCIRWNNMDDIYKYTSRTNVQLMEMLTTKSKKKFIHKWYCEMMHKVTK